MISDIELLEHADHPIISDKIKSNDIIALLSANFSTSSIYSNIINTHTKCMILIQMSTAGNTFDGLDGTEIVVNATVQSTNYIATNTSDQFTTTGLNMDFKNGSLDSTYTFKDSSGVANTSLVAKRGLFTGQVTAQYTTITPNSAQTVPGISVSGPVLNSDNLLPLLKVEKTAGGIATDMYNQSTSYPVLRLFNSSATPEYIQYSLANNLPTATTISHLFGRNTTANAESFLLQYYYNTIETNRKFMIKAWGDSAAALEVYQSAITGTSPTSGSVVVNGDLGSTQLRSKGLTLYGTSGSTKILPASTITSYQLTLPSSIGSVNDFLQLGSVSGTNGTLQWAAGTGGGGSAAYIAALSYTGSGSMPTSGSNYNISFGTAVYNVNTGITYGTGGPSSLFQNVSGGTLYIHVTSSITFATNATGDRLLAITVSADGSTTTSINTTRVGANATASQTTILNCSAIVIVPNNQWFGIRGSQTSGGSLSFSAVSVQAQVIGGSGMQSITLSALSTNQASTLFTTTTQQAGLSPTISFDLAQSPTGSGKFVLATSPTISGLTTTGTLTSSNIAASTISTPALTESAFEIDIANTTLYPTPTIQLTSSNTNIIIKGVRTGFTVYLPDATTLTVGYNIKILNTSSSSSVNIHYFGAGTLDTIFINQQIYYTVVDNTTSAGTWKVNSLLNHLVAETRNTGLYIKATKTLLLNTSSGEQVKVMINSDSSTYNYILPTTAGTAGQVLTSQGGSVPMTWSNVLTSQTKTPTFWWGNDSDSNSMTFTYLTFSPLTNQKYTYQQNGKLYNFSLCIGINISATTLDDNNCVFINDCDPPAPSQGEVTQINEFDNAPYPCTQLMIPAS